MNESDMGDEQTRQPAQQMQQPQPASNSQEKTRAARKFQETPGMASTLDGGDSSEASSSPGMDEARFAAGVVKLYEALLKEPIPEKMLKLVEEIGKQERK